MCHLITDKQILQRLNVSILLNTVLQWQCTTNPMAMQYCMQYCMHMKQLSEQRIPGVSSIFPHVFIKSHNDRMIERRPSLLPAILLLQLLLLLLLLSTTSLNPFCWCVGASGKIQETKIHGNKTIGQISAYSRTSAAQ